MIPANLENTILYPVDDESEGNKRKYRTTDGNFSIQEMPIRPGYFLVIDCRTLTCIAENASSPELARAWLTWWVALKYAGVDEPRILIRGIPYYVHPVVYAFIQRVSRERDRYKETTKNLWMINQSMNQ